MNVNRLALILIGCMLICANAQGATYDPVKGDIIDVAVQTYTAITSPYGPRNSGILDATTIHSGIDFRALYVPVYWFANDSSTKKIDDIYFGVERSEEQGRVDVYGIGTSKAGYVVSVGGYNYLHLKENNYDPPDEENYAFVEYGCFRILRKNDDNVWRKKRWCQALT